MSFYDDPKNVDKYVEMCKDYDGTKIITLLKKHLKEGSSLLEIGTGPGFDLSMLKEFYQTTGSDLSDEFIKRNQAKFPDLEILKLDAETLAVEKTFDCVYSNKVLHHLSTETLERALERQKSVLKEGGLFAHTFWVGGKEFTHEGLYFNFHDKEKLIASISKHFEIVELLDYQEFELNDSLFVLARN